MTGILKFIAVLCLIVFLVMLIYPWRLKNHEDNKLNNYDNKMSQIKYHAEHDMAVCKNLPMADERRLQAMEAMADVHARLMELPEAEQLLAEIWKAREVKRQEQDARKDTHFDEAFGRIMLRMAETHRDMGETGKIDEAVQNYDTILWYDQRYTDQNTEKRLARDMNNLGVIHYLKGLSFPKKADGLAEYQKSIDYFEDALKRYRAIFGKDSQWEANTLYNEALPLREIGRQSDADKAKAEALRISSLVKRSCVLP